jgi:hypothetical protein
MSRFGALRAGLTVALAAGVAGLTGCTGTADSHVSTCVVARLKVSADSSGVRITNPLPDPCQFSGRYPVTMKVWAMDGPEPPVAKGILASGSTYTQPYLPRVGNGCPALGDRRPGTVTVHVEGTVVGVSQDGQQAHEIAHCVVYAAGEPRIG